MKKENKNILISYGKWLVLVMLPIFIMGWYFNEPFINGITNSGSYYLYFLFISGAADGIMDTLQFHFPISRMSGWRPSFWDPSVSWKNKYKDRDPKKGRTWVPVIFTDAWHLFKAIRTAALCLGVVFFIGPDEQTWVNYFFAYGMYKWGFNAFYTYLKK